MSADELRAELERLRAYELEAELKLLDKEIRFLTVKVWFMNLKRSALRSFAILKIGLIVIACTAAAKSVFLFTPNEEESDYPRLFEAMKRTHPANPMEAVAGHYEWVGKVRVYANVDDKGAVEIDRSVFNKEDGTFALKKTDSGQIRWIKNWDYDYTDSHGHQEPMMLRWAADTSILTGISNQKIMWVFVDRQKIYEDERDNQ